MNYIKIIFTIFILSSFMFALDEQKEVPTFVTSKWLAENIDNKRLVIVDVRANEDFLKHHIKNAVNLPAMYYLFSDNQFIPSIETLRNTFSSVGIDNDSLVVGYGYGEFLFSARLYWILELLGHKNVGILNTSYSNWKLNNLPVQSGVYSAKRKNFIPRIDNTKIETKLSTLMSIGKKTIVDGRENNHYKGKESVAKRFGHIPSAININFSSNFEQYKDGNKIKNLSELSKMYKDIPKNKDVLLYCQGGAQSSLNYIVFKELGYEASVYNGSWLEWGNDSLVPIVNKNKK